MTVINAVVFDFDGVVVNSEPLYEKAELELFSYYGIDVDLEDIRDTKGLPEDSYLKLISERYHITIPQTELRKRGRKLLRRAFAEALDYMPGFLDFFHRIAEKVSTGLATSSGRAMLNWIFEHTIIENHFTRIVTADDVVRSKPFPDPYLKICRMLATDPGSTLVIEDSATGLQAAKAAGTIAVGFAGSARPAELTAADYIVQNYSEIERLVEDNFRLRKNK
ncbi:MAG: HAD family hydrolase [Fidelibacterota bacterium]